jgi:hypothetical protein
MSMIQSRMETIMVIIDESIVRLETREDQLMLACAMLQRTKEIFDATLGEAGRKEMFKDMSA